jgi:NADH-quinone oxidoreductase subunit M
LAFAALIGTWGTILSVYKFLHNLFLGQLPEKYRNIQKSPVNMQIPILVLSFTILLFGVLPGLPLKVINSIIMSFGFQSLNVTWWGIISETGTLNTINLFAAILIGCVIVWLILKTGPKSTSASQENTYAAGASIPEGKYHYTVDFYNPFYRMAKPYLRDFMDIFYIKLAGWIQTLCSVIRRIYTGYVGHYVTYIVLFLAVLIFMQLKWSLW